MIGPRALACVCGRLRAGRPAEKVPHLERSEAYEPQSARYRSQAVLRCSTRSGMIQACDGCDINVYGRSKGCTITENERSSGNVHTVPANMHQRIRALKAEQNGCGRGE